MVQIYLQAWQTAGPGQWERNGDVALAVSQMATKASHVHASQGFPYNQIGR